MDPNVFETANAGFAQVMYEEFLRDPASVDAEWRRLFESGVVGEAPPLNGTGSAARAPEASEPAPAPVTPAATPRTGHRRTHGRGGPDQGSRRAPRAEHEREPHRSHRDHLP